MLIHPINTINLTYFDVLTTWVDQPLIDLVTDTEQVITSAHISQLFKLLTRKYLHS